MRPDDPSSIQEFLRTAETGPSASGGRVVIVSDSVPERNGVGAYYQDLVDQLEDHCDAVGFLSPSRTGTGPRLPLPGDPTQKIWFPSYRRYSRLMREIQPECIIAATPGPYGLLGCWFARRRKIPFIVGFHTHFSGVTDQYKNVFLRTFSRLYFNFADWIMFRYADLTLANCEAMVELAQRLGAKRAEVMGTLLPVKALNTPISTPRTDFGRVIFAGRLAPEKRIDTVIDAARKLPSLKFTIAGDGPQFDELAAAQVELENVELLGWVNREGLLSAVDAADLLVLPSVVESFGTVALEAMARARLVLVSPTCGIVEWPDLRPWLFVIEDGETVADALQRIAAMPPEERTRMANGAADAARDLNDKSVRHWLSVLAEPRVTAADD